MELETTSALEYAELSMNNLKESAEQQLLIVEGDSNIADLQGFCAGVRVVGSALQENCLSYTYDSKAQPLIEQLSESAILSFDCEIMKLQESSEWQDFKDDLKKAVEEKKNFLYNEAKKGRDLAFVQGWKKAVSFIDEIFNCIQEKADELRKSPTLNF